MVEKAGGTPVDHGSYRALGAEQLSSTQDGSTMTPNKEQQRSYTDAVQEWLTDPEYEEVNADVVKLPEMSLKML